MPIKREVIGQEVPKREKPTALRPIIALLVPTVILIVLFFGSGGEAVKPATPPELAQNTSLTSDQRSATQVVEVGLRRAEQRAQQQAYEAASPPMVSDVVRDEAPRATGDWAPRGENGEVLQENLLSTPAARREADLQALVDQHLHRVIEAKLQRREMELGKAASATTGGGTAATPAQNEEDEEDEEDDRLDEFRKMQKQLLRQSSAEMAARSGGASLGHLPEIGSLSGLNGALSALGERGSKGDSDGRRERDDRKLDFFMHGGDQLRPGALETTVQPASGRYLLRMGSIIPCALLTAIHSESPGQITGMVTENVFDDVSQRYLLIPMGTKMVGTYSGAISMGDERVQAAAVRLNFRDGSTLDLGGMMIADAEGRAGLHDKVNRHLMKRIAAFLLNTSATVALEATRPPTPFGIESAVHRGIGEAVLQTANQMSQQASQIPPTLEIRQGARCTIAVAKDIAFPKPYNDGITQRRNRHGSSGRRSWASR